MKTNPLNQSFLSKYELHREDAVLLVIDIQEKLVPAMDGGQAVIERTAVLLQSADALELPVLVTEQYPRGLGATVKSLQALLPAQAQVFEKVSFDACTTQVLEALKKSGRSKVIIAGMETHVCVFQTVRRLLSEGYDVFLAQDAVCSRRSENRSNALLLIREMGAVVSNSETIVFDLLKVAGTPLFKQVSAFIK